MKTLLTFILTAASILGQSASAIFQFPGEPLGFTITVNPNGFTPEINGLETQLNSSCSGLTLASGVTSSSQTFTLANVSSNCVIGPGNGLAFGCGPSGGCTNVAVVKAAGCTNNVCSVIQGTLGTTPGTFAAGTPVTVIQFGTGGATVCALIPILQNFAQRGAVTIIQPSNPANASAAIATQNTTITTAAATILSLINNAFTCTANN